MAPTPLERLSTRARFALAQGARVGWYGTQSVVSSRLVSRWESEIPEEERKRLITGSPSLPQEVDHFVFGGQRDWSKRLRVLVAGGGTGDGLIQLTTLLTQYVKAYEAVYVDLSEASRRVAEARARLADPAHAHLTVLGVGLDAGFASKSTFNRVVKEQTGETPSAYRQRLAAAARPDAS